MKNNQLLNGSLIFFFIIIGGLVISAYSKYSKEYKTPISKIHQDLIEESHLIKYYDFIAEPSNDDKFLIIDLRTEEEYKISHINNAINIPSSVIFEKSSINKIRKSKKQIVLYSDSQNFSSMCFLMLQSLGIKNIKVLAGSFDIFNKYIIEEFTPSYLFYDSEKIKWNYNNFIKSVEKNEMPDLEPILIRAQGGC